jgi:hypothetical protein
MRSIRLAVVLGLALATLVAGLVSVARANGYATVCFPTNGWSGCSLGDTYNGGISGCQGFNEFDCEDSDGESTGCSSTDPTQPNLCVTRWYLIQPPPPCSPGEPDGCGNFAVFWCEWLGGNCIAYEIDPGPQSCLVTTCSPS